MAILIILVILIGGALFGFLTYPCCIWYYHVPATVFGIAAISLAIHLVRVP